MDNRYDILQLLHQVAEGAVMVRSGSAEDNIDCQDISELRHVNPRGLENTIVLKEDGKELSANDYTDADKAKLDAITEGATRVEPSETLSNIKINGVETSIFQVATDEEISAMLDEVLGPTENA